MPFIELSGAFSLDIGRKRKQGLEALDITEAELEAALESETEIADEQPKIKMGFQREEVEDKVRHGRYHAKIEDAIAEAEQLRKELFGEFAGRG